jgi:two-component system, OmpR family, sensor histidine kinase KdpD
LGQLIERKAEDMTQLLSNVLDLAKMESADQPLRAEWHVLDDLVTHSIGANASQLVGWRTAVRLRSDLPLVFVEANLIVQILSNLLQNAAKYTPLGSTITISTRKANVWCSKSPIMGRAFPVIRSAYSRNFSAAIRRTASRV